MIKKKGQQPGPIKGIAVHEHNLYFTGRKKKKHNLKRQSINNAVEVHQLKISRRLSKQTGSDNRQMLHTKAKKRREKQEKITLKVVKNHVKKCFNHFNKFSQTQTNFRRSIKSKTKRAHDFSKEAGPPSKKPGPLKSRFNSTLYLLEGAYFGKGKGRGKKRKKGEAKKSKRGKAEVNKSRQVDRLNEIYRNIKNKLNKTNTKFGRFTVKPFSKKF